VVCGLRILSVVCGLRILSLRSAACATVGAIACGLSNCLVKKTLWEKECNLGSCLVNRLRPA
jgi:hypothetical protein